MGEQQPAGVIEGLSRILRELLRTPEIKQTLQILLRELDPHNAPLLVRAIKEEEPELFLSLLSAAPALLGVPAAIINELLRQVHSFPDGLARSFAADLIEEMPVERAGENAALAMALGMRLVNESASPVAAAVTQVGARWRAGFEAGLEHAGVASEDLDAWLIERGVKFAQTWAQRVGKQAAQPDSPTARHVAKIADGVERALRENPDFTRHVLQPLIDAGAAGQRAASDGDQHER